LKRLRRTNQVYYRWPGHPGAEHDDEAQPTRGGDNEEEFHDGKEKGKLGKI